MASQLKAVFDRELRVDLNQINNTPEGRVDDGLAPNMELIGLVDSPSGPVPVELVRTEDGNNRKIWLFSASTVRQNPGARPPLPRCP